jgi:hypothetical protein
MASTSERSKFTSKSMMRTVTLHKESRHVKLGIQFFSKWDVDRRAKKLTSDEQQILEQSAIIQEPPTNGPAAGLFYPGERIVLINNFLVQDPHDAARQLGSASGDIVIQVLPAFEGFDLSKPFDELPNASLAGSSGLSKATKEALRVLLHGLAPPTTVSQDKATMPALNCMGSPPLSPPLSPQLSPPPGKILASARKHRDAQREAQQAMQFVRTHKLNHSELSNAKAVPKKEKESTLFKSFIDKVSKGQLFGKAAKTRSKASATPIVASPPVSNRPDSAVSSAVPSAVPSAQSSARGRMHSLISVMLEDADHVDDELEEKEEETSMVETQAAQHLTGDPKEAPPAHPFGTAQVTALWASVASLWSWPQSSLSVQPSAPQPLRRPPAVQVEEEEDDDDDEEDAVAAEAAMLAALVARKAPVPQTAAFVQVI